MSVLDEWKYKRLKDEVVKECTQNVLEELGRNKQKEKENVEENEKYRQEIKKAMQ